MASRGPEEPQEDERYPAPDTIDWSRIQHIFGQLVLFDDVFLNMQAINVSIVDGFVTDQEYVLLGEYFASDSTPTQQAMFVSALSQMWIFALYELLRTWRGRIRAIQKWYESGAIPAMLARLEKDEHNLGALMRSRHLERARDDPAFRNKLQSHLEAMEHVFRLTEGIRINLAKHEVRGKSNIIVRAPGYGRINGRCGALDFEMDMGDNSFTFINRRDIAEAFRRVDVSDPE